MLPRQHSTHVASALLVHYNDTTAYTVLYELRVSLLLYAVLPVVLRGALLVPIYYHLNYASTLQLTA